VLRNGGGGPALTLLVNSGVPALTATSDARIPNLNADLLDGMDSTEFIRGAGQAVGETTTIASGTGAYLGPPLAGFLRFSYSCPSTLSSNGLLFVYNESGATANVFLDSGGANPIYHSMANGGATFLMAAAAGDSFVIQAQGPLGVITVLLATVNRTTDCYAQAQAVLAS
jgi:hypothetical protein